MKIVIAILALLARVLQLLITQRAEEATREREEQVGRDIANALKEKNRTRDPKILQESLDRYTTPNNSSVRDNEDE